MHDVDKSSLHDDDRVGQSTSKSAVRAVKKKVPTRASKLDMIGSYFFSGITLVAFVLSCCYGFLLITIAG